jgi:HEAT repeat protein
VFRLLSTILAILSPEVIHSAAWALSHLGTGPAVAALIGLSGHPDPGIRQAVACCIALRKHPQVTPILTTLMEDENEVVRDWATFSLASSDFEKSGALHYRDSPEIRAAFYRRLNDTYEDARREALWGLATRKDPVGLKLLLEYLESENWWSGDESAAEETVGAKPGTPVEELCQELRRLLAESQ